MTNSKDKVCNFGYLHMFQLLLLYKKVQRLKTPTGVPISMSRETRPFLVKRIYVFVNSHFTVSMLTLAWNLCIQRMASSKQFFSARKSSSHLGAWKWNWGFGHFSKINVWGRHHCISF